MTSEEQSCHVLFVPFDRSAIFQLRLPICRQRSGNIDERYCGIWNCGGNFLKWKTGNFIYTKKCDEASLSTHGSRFVYCGCWGCLRSCEVCKDGERRKHATCLLFVCRMKVTTTNIGTFITNETKRSGLAAQSKALQRAASACSRTGNFTELFLSSNVI